MNKLVTKPDKINIVIMPVKQTSFFYVTRHSIIQWNLDLTKSLGTGQICSLNRGFVISKISI